ncbi:EAL domain-containing protein, partial [Hydrogenophaga sp.]|uniref:EAL domain-containing protein n=1 Tax=Hydrogenophaga sp. TaxID=1904254 RepID=UPI003562DED7
TQEQSSRLRDLALAVEHWLQAQQTRLALRQVQADQHSLFEHMADGVLMLDRHHRLLDANRAALCMLGMDNKSSLSGHRLHDVVVAAQHERLDAIRASANPGSAPLFECDIVRADGSHFPAELSLRSVDAQRLVAVVRDITPRREQEHQLRQLSMVVEQSPTAVLITGLDGRIEYVNAAAMHCTGFPRDELQGRNPQFMRTGAMAPGAYRAMRASLLRGEVWRGAMRCLRKNGQAYLAATVVTPLRGASGDLAQYLVTLEDITDIQRMSGELAQHRHHLETLVEERTRDLEIAKQTAEAASQSKSGFLATMSHEIRTPMNGVVGIVDVLLQSSLTPYQSDLADTIRDSAFALLGIIDDILDFSKIEAGHLTLEREPVHLLRLIEGVCEGLQPVAMSRVVTMRVYVDPGLPEVVVSDSVRLRQILNNLVGNAIKFSSGLDRVGQVAVRAEMGAAGQWQLRVSDNGIGMSPEAQSRIFKPFVQAESSTTRRYGGTGLGLSICHRLAALFGGDVTVSSEVDQGTTFTVSLPLQVDDPAAAPATAEAPEHDLSNLVCHVVLRDALLGADWGQYLQAAGAEVRFWSDLSQLLGAFESDSDVGVVIADHEHELHGIATPDFAVVTVGTGQMRAAKLMAPGLVSLEVNPLRRSTMLHAVAMAAGRAKELPAEAHSEHEREAVLPSSVDDAAANGRLVLVAEDNEINQKVIRRQLALLGFAIELANDGLDALQRWRNGRDSQRHGLLLTDLQMPGMDGYSLAAAIRAEETGDRRLPIVALTANASRGEVERCKSEGMNDYLVKPVQLHQLAEVLLRWLPQTNDLNMLPTLANPVAQATAAVHEELPVFDSEALGRQVGDEPELLAEFRQRYLVSAQSTVAEIRSAADAGELEKVGDLAHRLKSSSRVVGAMSLGECCHSLELAGHAAEADQTLRLVARMELELDHVCTQLKALLNPAETPAAPSAEMGVLLVDDAPQDRLIMQRQLELLGAGPVHSSTSGQAALEWLDGRDSAAMLLLLDLNMPGMDGVEFMRHLANRGYAGALALVSGTDLRVLETASKLAKAYQLNVLGHLQKPVTTDSLRHLVEGWHGFIPARKRIGAKVYAVTDIRRAIEAGELRLHFQPKVRLSDGAWVGVEALVRWQHPSDGLLMPDSFVPVAETHGLIDALTRDVLKQALQAARHWRESGLALRVSVNVSMENLAGLDFPEFVLAQAQQHGVPATDLVLEVTESRLANDARATVDILTRLRLKEFGLSIDDFGTGHCSLAQLRDIPFDELKIDRSFVHGSGNNSTQQAIFTASLEMAHDLGMSVVAEGVEDRADWDFVRASGCDVAQGHFVARPMPLEALTEWSNRWQWRVKNL